MKTSLCKSLVRYGFLNFVHTRAKTGAPSLYALPTYLRSVPGEGDSGSPSHVAGELVVELDVLVAALAGAGGDGARGDAR